MWQALRRPPRYKSKNRVWIILFRILTIRRPDFRSIFPHRHCRMSHQCVCRATSRRHPYKRVSLYDGSRVPLHNKFSVLYIETWVLPIQARVSRRTVVGRLLYTRGVTMTSIRTILRHTRRNKPRATEVRERDRLAAYLWMRWSVRNLLDRPRRLPILADAIRIQHTRDTSSRRRRLA